MAKSFTLDQLTEGIRHRHMGSQNQQLVEKWSRTGLLRGLENYSRENMAMLLENQASQLLRETNSLGTGAGGGTASGDIRGFTNIAFPIVRRVFGGLIANELVSIQPMSLPSGLLFYLDYTYGTRVGGDTTLSSGAAGSADAQTYALNQSIYNNPTGKGVRSGSQGVGGQYDLVGTAYSKVHSASGVPTAHIIASGAFQGAATLSDGAKCFATGTDGKMLQYDPQITDLIEADTSAGTNGQFQLLFVDPEVFGTSVDLTHVKDIALFTGGETSAGSESYQNGMGVVPASIQGGNNILNVRRLTQLGKYKDGKFTAQPLIGRADADAAIMFVVSGTLLSGPATTPNNLTNLTASCVISPTLNVDSSQGDTLTIPSFESDFSTSDASPIIPEIDIKIESIAVTAATRKLRARWSPELAQDLNAYHSLDAEVELTQILSEQIALEIDREILNDLLTEANGANYYWSRMPGKFVNKKTGAEATMSSTLAAGPQFTGTVREWYETLVETIIDVANEIHRKTLRGSANFIVTSPDVATIFEASVLYKPNYSLDGQGQVGNPMQLGAAPIGSLSNRFTVYKDPYFPRNKILVGYKGGSYLETGYVYAPYVPLIVTPTIFAPEDFTPRKGVMTRYGKKMVRSDFYGTVTCIDMNVI
jgi:hypothetical protein